jgi:LCP family protein required for cell wall assembly
MKRAVVIFLVVANVVVFGALGAVWWAANKVSSAVSTVPDLSLPGNVDLSQPRVFLLVGSDSRESLDDLTNFGPAGGQRADVIILAKVVPADGRVQLLSIPRDLRIDYGGRTGRINATFGSGAADLVAAVSDETGVTINHYLQVEFGGFASIVDAIGGIRITFPYPARDLSSGLEVGAGTQLLDGDTALSYARSRKYQELRNGDWVSVDANDIGRTRRQQDVLLAILTQVDRPTSIGGFQSLLDALGEFVTVDSGFDAEEILQLAWSMRSISGSDVESMTLPVQGFAEGGTAYVVRVEPEASTVIDAFIADALGYGEVIVGRTPIDVEVVVIVGADAPTG